MLHRIRVFWDSNLRSFIQTSNYKATELVSIPLSCSMTSQKLKTRDTRVEEERHRKIMRFYSFCGRSVKHKEIPVAEWYWVGKTDLIGGDREDPLSLSSLQNQRGHIRLWNWSSEKTSRRQTCTLFVKQHRPTREVKDYVKDGNRIFFITTYKMEPEELRKHSPTCGVEVSGIVGN